MRDYPEGTGVMQQGPSDGANREENGTGHYWSKKLDIEVSCGRKMTHCKIVCLRCGIETRPYLTRRGLFNSWNRRVNNDSEKV